MTMRGYRNVSLCYGYFATMLLFGAMQVYADGSLKDLAALAGSVGVAVIGIVWGRGYNKKAENGGGS
jgi:hypothetical protein